MIDLSAEPFVWTDAVPWIIASLGVLVAFYFGKKNHTLAKAKRREENRKYEKEETLEAKEGLKVKTSLDRYKQHIYNQFKEIDFTGLNAYQKKLPLERVYIRLRAKEKYNIEDYRTILDFEKLGEEIAGRKKEEQEEIVSKTFNETFSIHSYKSSNKRESLKMLILGHPGSGKTTLFKWIALQCVKPKPDETSKPFSGLIPCFISLKDFARNTDWLKKDIRSLVADKNHGEAVDLPFFNDSFERNEIIFLLDGLDEVADEDLRRDVIEWIQKQNIRRNKLLVSSRFSGLNPQKGLLFNADFNSFIIEDLDDADIEQFLHKWYEAIETVLEDSEKNREEAKRQADELINVIKSKGYEPLRKIAVNPLLLTIVAIVHRNRAKLPKERHKLYEECLNVMIELWHISHKQLKTYFPAEVCKNNLAILAQFAMLHNKREVTRQEITQLLPATIENKPLDFFLTEMVLKTGLLYESEGKYGFLHLTFQEYLAAWYYARSSKPLDILEHRDKDYWTETIKLFVNLGNTRQFFNEIIENLDEKYWQQMNLWEDCLRYELIDEGLKEEIELKFARKVCEILFTIPFEESEEEKIVQLFPHYSLYIHAEKLEKQGWELFQDARHPFVKSVGASVLNQMDDKIRSWLFQKIKLKLKTYTLQNEFEFIIENNNSFLLLIAMRKRIIDFVFTLMLLKNNNQLVQYLNLLDFIRLFDLQYLPDLRELKGSNEYLKMKEYIGSKELLKLKYLFYILDLKNCRFLKDLRLLLNFQDFRFLLQQFEVYYKPIIQQHQPEIHAWADKALEKLQGLSDEEILKYFPNSTAEDMKEFRANHPPKIVCELKKGNNAVLLNHYLSTETLEETRLLVDKENQPGAFYQILVSALKENFEDEQLKNYKRRVVEWLTETGQLVLDEPTMHFLLEFDLYTDNPERQETEMKAQRYLCNLDYARWRELLIPFTQMRSGKSAVWVNALYVFKTLG